MSNVTVRIPTPLRSMVDDREAVPVEAETVDQALERLTRQNEKLRAQLYGDDGELRNFVNVYLGDRDVRELGSDHPLEDGDELAIVPSIAGGASPVGPPASDVDETDGASPGVDGEGAGGDPTADGMAGDGGDAAVGGGSSGGGPDAGGPRGTSLVDGRPLPGLSSEEVRRYGRHLTMPEVGREGQRKLKAARVLMVGAGGLGSPVGMYLAAAGVGHLGIVDFDRVEFSNLHRQILHDTPSVGRPKLESARERLQALNPEVEVEAHETRLTSDNALEILEGYDLVVDGSDNFPTRYLVNDASVLAGIPSVYGAIFRFDGQASVFGTEEGPCYRCLFREPPPAGLVPSCAEAGVLGILPGIVGTIQATEAIKLILGRGRSLAGRLLLVDALEMEFREVEIRKDPDCPVCGEDPEVTELIDYEAFCGVAEDGGDEAGVPAIDVETLRARARDGGDFQLLDVREDHEWEICNLEELGAVRIPLGDLPQHLHELDPGLELVVHCRSGGRSAKAVELLRQAGFDAVNLEGGILAWAEEIDPEMPTY